MYVLNQSTQATYNIEKKLRDLTANKKYENFVHIFGIYDICQSEIERLPQLLAIRGVEGYNSFSDTEFSDGQAEEEKPKVPYFHISAARVGGTAEADGGFAAKCLKFAKLSSKDDGLIEFPTAWSKKFPVTSESGKTYTLSFDKRRIEEGYVSDEEVRLETRMETDPETP